MIPYGRQDISQADIDAVVEVLRSDFLTQGPCVPQFEEAICKATGAEYAVAVNSATSALHIACAALGLEEGDWLWTTPNTFVASANCALYCNAKVDFVDIDPRTYNISVDALTQKLERASELGCLPKIVVPVHFSGQSCEMAQIHELSQHFGFRIIEDASHAIGGKYRDRPIGDCRFSDITVFSFHPVKIVTTAEGGAATTQDPRLAQKMQLLRSHGVTRDTGLMDRKSKGPWYYEQVDLGFNYRMTDLQAALGTEQMKRLHPMVARRHELAERYDEALADLPLTTPWRNPDSYSAFHLYVVRLQLHANHKTHREVFESLRDQGIGVNLHYIPVHLQPWYRKMGFKEGDFPEAEQYYSEAISLPMFPSLSAVQQDKVIAAIKGAIS